MVISFCVGLVSDRLWDGLLVSIRRYGPGGSAAADVWYVTASAVFRLNPPPVFGVGLGMRDFETDISRGLAAAGVLVSAVVHLTGWSRAFATRGLCRDRVWSSHRSAAVARHA
jgi:hypothetical protein